jgi:histone H2A
MVGVTKRISQSSRAGLLFPVSRINRNLRLMPLHAKRITKASAVYVTAVLEYLTGR